MLQYDDFCGYRTRYEIDPINYESHVPISHKNPFSDDFTFVDHFSASVPAPPAGTVSDTPVPTMHTVPVLEHPVPSAILLAPATVPDPDPPVPDTVAPDPATVPALEHPVPGAVLLAPATVPEPDPTIPDTVAPYPATVPPPYSNQHAPVLALIFRQFPAERPPPQPPPTLEAAAHAAATADATVATAGCYRH